MAAGGEAAGDLVISDLSVVYAGSRGALTAIEHLSLSVAAGEFVAVLGPSGCGKSTLLKVVSGLIAPSGGTVNLAGRPVSGPRPDVGIVFQQPTLLPWKTVRENILVPIRALRRPVADYAATTDRLLALVGLADFANHYPYELSGGMQQRVGVARGLVHDPHLLLMDEPFAALDAMTREHMMAELQALWMATRKSVLFITHSIPEAVFLADRIVVLSARPARTLEEIHIDLPRPRAIETMALPAFAELCTRLRRLFGPLAPPSPKGTGP
jgi:NitT/TauT family transport system ATP-binding protein